MKSEFDKAKNVLNKQFGKERKLYIATTVDGIPYVELVSTYYIEGSFHIEISKTSLLKDRIKLNPNVVICTAASFHKFNGLASVAGNLDFGVVKVELTNGFTYSGKKGYNFNFTDKTAESFPYTPFG